MISPYRTTSVDVNDPPNYSTPAFTVADGWNMDVTLAHYIAVALNNYLNDPYRNDVGDDNLRRAIVTFAFWSLDGSWGSNTENVDALDDALAFFAANFTRLWS